jgi:geranylgeranyl diphosphate synthase type II
MLINALKLAKGDDFEKLSNYLKKSFQQPEDKIKLVTEMYNKLSVKKICEDKMIFYFDKAVANLDKIQVNEAKKHELRNLATKLLDRND